MNCSMEVCQKKPNLLQNRDGKPRVSRQTAGLLTGQPGFLSAKAVFKGSWAQKEAEIEKIEIGCANRVRNVFNEWNSYGINDG